MVDKTGDVELANRLKKLRKDRNFTQELLAEKSGIALSTIQKIESTKQYGRKDTHQKLADALGVSVSLLLFGKEEAPRPKSRLTDIKDDDIEIEPELAKYITDPSIQIYFSKPYLSRLSNRMKRQLAMMIKLDVEGDEEE